MRTFLSRVAMTVLVSCVLCWCLTGCSDPTEPQPNPEDIVNPDKPSSNDRIVSQTVIGDASGRMSLWDIRDDHAGGYCFGGVSEGYYGVGRLGGAGNLSWFYRTGFGLSDVFVLPASSVVPNAFLTLGAPDTDGDGQSDVGYVSLMSPSGTLLSQAVYSADTADVWLASTVLVSDSTFVCVGGHRTATMTHPFIASYVVTSAGQVQRRNHAIVTDLPGCRFIYMDAEEGQLPGAEWVFYAVSRCGTDAYAIHKITVDWPSVAAWTIEWSFDVAVAGALNPSVGDLRAVGGNVYWVGGADDPAKEPRPTTGGYWRSAVAGSVSSSGQSRWAALVRVTGHSDRFQKFVATPGALYGVGYCGSFTRDDQALGYGWVCRMGTDTGGVTSSMSFGDDSYSSGFNDGILDGNILHCGGWTHNEVSGGVYRGWICHVNVSATSFTNPSPAASRLGDACAAVPDGGRVWFVND